MEESHYNVRQIKSSNLVNNNTFSLINQFLESHSLFNKIEVSYIKELLVDNARYQQIPPETVYQHQDNEINQCTFICNGQLFQYYFDSVIQQNELITTVDQNSPLMLNASDQIYKRKSTFTFKTHQKPCDVIIIDKQLFNQYLLAITKNILQEKVDLLKQFSWFNDFSQQTQTKIAEQFQFIEYSQKDIIFDQSQLIQEPRFLFLLQGEFSISKKLKKFQTSSDEQKQSEIEQKIIYINNGEILGFQINEAQQKYSKLRQSQQISSASVLDYISLTIPPKKYPFKFKCESKSAIIGSIPYSTLNFMAFKFDIIKEQDLISLTLSRMKELLNKTNKVQESLFLQQQYRFQNLNQQQNSYQQDSSILSIDTSLNKIQRQKSMQLAEKIASRNLKKLQSYQCIPQFTSSSSLGIYDKAPKSMNNIHDEINDSSFTYQSNKNSQTLLSNQTLSIPTDKDENKINFNNIGNSINQSPKRTLASILKQKGLKSLTQIKSSLGESDYIPNDSPHKRLVNFENLKGIQLEQLLSSKKDKYVKSQSELLQIDECEMDKNLIFPAKEERLKHKKLFIFSSPKSKQENSSQKEQFQQVIEPIQQKESEKQNKNCITQISNTSQVNVSPVSPNKLRQINKKNTISIIKNISQTSTQFSTPQKNKIKSKNQINSTQKQCKGSLTDFSPSRHDNQWVFIKKLLLSDKNQQIKKESNKEEKVIEIPSKEPQQKQIERKYSILNEQASQKSRNSYRSTKGQTQSLKQISITYFNKVSNLAIEQDKDKQPMKQKLNIFYKTCQTNSSNRSSIYEQSFSPRKPSLQNLLNDLSTNRKIKSFNTKQEDNASKISLKSSPNKHLSQTLIKLNLDKQNRSEDVSQNKNQIFKNEFISKQVKYYDTLKYKKALIENFNKISINSANSLEENSLPQQIKTLSQQVLGVNNNLEGKFKMISKAFQNMKKTPQYQFRRFLDQNHNERKEFFMDLNKKVGYI